MSDIYEQALALDREAEEIVSHVEASFVRIGRIMTQMCDGDKWALLKDPVTGKNYTSRERWIEARFRSKRATAYAAFGVYRQLQGKVPDAVMEVAEVGCLKVMAMLPEKAQRSLAVQEQMLTKTVSEFTSDVLTRYPDQLIELTIDWRLRPTVSQGALYDRILAKVQDWYLQKGESISREEALEYILQDCEERL